MYIGDMRDPEIGPGSAIIDGMGRDTPLIAVSDDRHIVKLPFLEGGNSYHDTIISRLIDGLRSDNQGNRNSGLTGWHQHKTSGECVLNQRYDLLKLPFA